MTSSTAGVGNHDRFEDLVPRWMFAVRWPAMQALVAVAVPACFTIPLVLVDDPADYRLGPLLVVSIVLVASIAGWLASLVAGTQVLLAYWYFAVPVTNSFSIEDAAAWVAVGGMAAFTVFVAVLTHRVERVVDDVRALDAARLDALAEQEGLRAEAEATAVQVRGALLVATTVAGAHTQAAVAKSTLDAISLPARITDGSIAIVRDDRLRVLASVGAPPEAITALEQVDLRTSRWLEGVLGGRTSLVDDRGAFAAEHPEEAVLTLYRAGSWAAVPFRSAGAVGLLSVHWAEPQEVSTCELHYELLGEIIATALERADAEERDEQRLAELELAFAERDRIARTLSTTLLPPALPRLPDFATSAWLLPGTTDQVAGDFYDVFPAEDRGWVAVLGDVCGKGAEAAAVTSLARYAARVASLSDPHPQRIAELANTALLADRSELFCTMAIVHYDRAADEVEVALAGHPQVRLVTPTGVERIGQYGTALGLANDAPPTVRIAFRPGDRLVLFSDGLIERTRAYGEDELDADLAEWAGLTAEALAGAIRDRVATLPADRPDDVAVLVIGRTA